MVLYDGLTDDNNVDVCEARRQSTDKNVINTVFSKPAGTKQRTSHIHQPVICVRSFEYPFRLYYSHANIK